MDKCKSKMFRLWKLDKMKKSVFFSLMLVSVILSVAVPMVFVDFVDEIACKTDKYISGIEYNTDADGLCV